MDDVTSRVSETSRADYHIRKADEYQIVACLEVQIHRIVQSPLLCLVLECASTQEDNIKQTYPRSQMSRPY